MSFPIVGAIRPSPTDEEAAALAAALELLWPTPIAAEQDSVYSKCRYR